MRIDLKGKGGIHSHEEKTRVKYEVPKTKAQKMFREKNRKNTSKAFCKYDKIRLAKAITDRKLSKIVCYSLICLIYTENISCL